MIYEIVCNETGERYIGSTFEPTLAKRMTTHRNKYNPCISRQIIGRGNYSYNLLEKVDVTTRDELRMKERVWYDKLTNINKNKPYQSKEELKELKSFQAKNRYELNKEERKEKQRAYYLKQKMALTMLSQVPPEVVSLSYP
jgi:hypothetical protein